MRQAVYRGRVVDLGLEHVTLPNGVEIDLEVVRHAGAAGVVAVDERTRVVLIEQYRHAAGGFLWEIPAGVLHPGEAPEACAGRELAEEVGLAAERFALLGSMLPTPGYSDERIYLFLAHGLRAVPLARDHDEVIRRVEMEKTVQEFGFEQADLTQIAENAEQMQKDLAALGAEIYKRHRIYTRSLR